MDLRLWPLMNFGSHNIITNFQKYANLSTDFYSLETFKIIALFNYLLTFNFFLKDLLFNLLVLVVYLKYCFDLYVINILYSF